MAQVLPIGYGNAVYVFSLAGLARQVTFSIGYKPGTPLLADPSPDAATIRDAVSAAGGPYEAGQMSTEWTFEGVNVVEMTATGPVVGSSYVPLTGTLSAASTSSPPANCAILLTKYTARGGRQGRGRCFLPFVSSEGNVNSAGFLGAGIGPQIAGKWAAAITTMDTNGVPAYLLHSQKFDPITGLPVGTPPAPDKITSIAIGALLATQRRRMR